MRFFMQNKAGLVTICASLALLACGGGGGGGAAPQPGGPGGGSAAGTCDNPAPTGVAVQANTIRGFVVDKCGKPIAGAQISAFIPGIQSNITGVSAADGSYSVPLTPGLAYIAYAYVTTKFDGRSICSTMDFDGPISFGSAQGTVRNFIWRLGGPAAYTADGETLYNGGKLREIFNEVVLENADPDKVVLEFKFEPLLPLLDGSTSEPFVRTVSFSQISKSPPAFQGIPITNYKLTALVRFEDGRETPVLVNQATEIKISFGELGNDGAGDIKCAGSAVSNSITLSVL
jgi:hypothetical protein